MDLFEVLGEKLVEVYGEGIEGCGECIFSTQHPSTLTRKILQTYEERLKVLDSPQPLKLLRGYLVFIGDLSKSYDFACDTFIKCLREAQRKASSTATCAEGLSDFDYLQQEEQKLQEEDAVLRFARMLLDGDSMPGCYVPFLHELASNGSLPTILRASAAQSLGHYMLSNIDLAEKYKGTLDMWLQSNEPEMKLAALFLAEKLILTFPNNYVNILDRVLSLLHDDDSIKDAAFSIYANLILEKKFKLDVLLGPICTCLCDSKETICSIAIYLMKRLVQDAGKAKHKLLISLWNNCTDARSQKKLAEVFAAHILDIGDLQSDELASSVLQILVLGQHAIALMASLLHPSLKVLQTLDSYFSSCPPKIDLKGDPQAREYLLQFVKNRRQSKTSIIANEKEVIGRLLEKLQTRGLKKRKHPILATTQEISTSGSLVDYEKAIQSFKQSEVTSNLWELFRPDSS